MTTSAEERARAVCARITHLADWRDREAVITEAIRQAENDKLEEAAKAAERQITGEHSDFGSGGDCVAEDIAEEIRSLKSKD